MKQQCLFSQVYSMIDYVDMQQVKTEWGVCSEEEREIEQQTSGVRDGAFDRNGNGVGQKWTLVKVDTLVFLVMQIDRTNKLSIKLGRSRIVQFYLVPKHSFSWQHVSPHCLSFIIKAPDECPNSVHYFKSHGVLMPRATMPNVSMPIRLVSLC